VVQKWVRPNKRRQCQSPNRHVKFAKFAKRNSNIVPEAGRTGRTSPESTFQHYSVVDRTNGTYAQPCVYRKSPQGSAEERYVEIGHYAGIKLESGNAVDPNLAGLSEAGQQSAEDRV